MEVYNKSDLLYGWSFSVGKNRPHDLIYYEGRFIVMVSIIRVRILYQESLGVLPPSYATSLGFGHT